MKGKILAAVLCIAAGGCAVPELEVTAHPKDASLFLDGQRLRQPGTRIPLPYYGTLELSGLESGSTPRHQPGRQQVEVPPPFSGWLFPLDFFLELGSYPFRGATTYLHRRELTLKERPPLEPGTSPDDTDGLCQRANQARLAR